MRKIRTLHLLLTPLVFLAATPLSHAETADELFQKFQSKNNSKLSELTESPVKDTTLETPADKAPSMLEVLKSQLKSRTNPEIASEKEIPVTKTLELQVESVKEEAAIEKPESEKASKEKRIIKPQLQRAKPQLQRIQPQKTIAEPIQRIQPQKVIAEPTRPTIQPSVAPAPVTVAKDTEPEKETWNLKGIDILTLISQVSKETGKNFIVDPKVKGNVTMISSHPMDADEVYQIFLSILQVHGYTAIETGAAIKIIPDREAKLTATPIVEGENTKPVSEMITMVTHVENVPADQLVKVLQPLVPKIGHLAAYAASNDIVTTDFKDNIEKISEIIRRLDKPMANDVEIIPLEYAAASDLVATLTTLLKQQGKQTAAITLASDERTNSILISGGKDNRLHIRALITQLDISNQIAGGETQVLYLKYLRAKDVAPIISSLIEGQTAGADATRSSQLSTAASSAIASSRTTTPSAFRTGFQPTSLGDRITSMGPDSNEARGGAISTSVQWEETTNAVIITAPPALMRTIKNVLAKLDIRRAQVIVEVIIAEVSIDRAKELGIEWNSGGSLKVATRLPTAVTAAAAQATSTLGSLPLVGDFDGSIGAGAGLSLGYFSNGNLRGLLRALELDTASNILSTPNLVTLDNEEAQIQVVRKLTFATGTSENQVTTGGNPFTSFTREPVGLTLTIRPQITPVGTIKMAIETSLSSTLPTAQQDPDSTAPNSGNINTAERNIATNVMIDDGEILVLGGLIQEDWQESDTKVPVLGDIPLIGKLFRSHAKILTKNNLMIFIRPVILRTTDDNIEVSGDKYQYIRAQQQNTQLAAHDSTIEKYALPILPHVVYKGLADQDSNHIPGPFEK